MKFTIAAIIILGIVSKLNAGPAQFDWDIYTCSPTNLEIKGSNSAKFNNQQLMEAAVLFGEFQSAYKYVTLAPWDKGQCVRIVFFNEDLRGVYIDVANSASTSEKEVRFETEFLWGNDEAITRSTNRVSLNAIEADGSLRVIWEGEERRRHFLLIPTLKKWTIQFTLKPASDMNVHKNTAINGALERKYVIKRIK